MLTSPHHMVVTALKMPPFFHCRISQSRPDYYSNTLCLKSMNSKQHILYYSIKLKNMLFTTIVKSSFQIRLVFFIYRGIWGILLILVLLTYLVKVI